MSQKKNWMEALERELRQLPEEDRLGIILNYKEQITVMLDEGKSEDEILERLGLPKEVAKEAKQALGYDSKFDFNHEDLFESVKNGANATINQFSDAIKRQSDDSSVREKLLYLALLVFLCFMVVMVGSVAFGLVIGGGAVFFVSFLFIHVTISLFLLCLSIGILLINSGLGLFYAIYPIGRHLILKIR